MKRFFQQKEREKYQKQEIKTIHRKSSIGITRNKIKTNQLNVKYIAIGKYDVYENH